jgi:ribosomal protein L11 methyltransferase
LAVEKVTMTYAMSMLMMALAISGVEAFMTPWLRTSSRPRPLFATDDGGMAPLQEILMRIDCNDVSPDDFTDFLFELGVSSVSIEIESEKDVLNDKTQWNQLGKPASWNTALVRAHIPSTFDSGELLNIVESSGMPFELQTIEGIDSSKDWVSEVQKAWKPEQVTSDLSIRFPWHEDADVVTPNELVLEAGAAFGTGGHQTTRLCCQWLERELKGGSAESVLDYGCGSAILALVALHYGCKQADGTDIDMDSLYAARRNALKNDLSDRLNLFMAYDVDDDSTATKNNALKGAGEGTEESFPDVAQIEGKTYPLVVANILAPILIALSEDMFAKTQAGGKVALSGVIERQSQSVVEAYTAAGFTHVVVEKQMDEWVLITGIKR